MSLRIFHLCFIISSLLLLIAFGFWSFDYYGQNNQNVAHLLTGCLALFSSGGLAIYANKFRKTLRNPTS